MAWAQKPTEGASSYTTILCYSRANSIFTQVGLHLGCNMYGHGWILDNVDLRNCSAMVIQLLQGHYQLYWKYIKQTITAVLVGHMETCI